MFMRSRDVQNRDLSPKKYNVSRDDDQAIVVSYYRMTVSVKINLG